MAIRLKSSKLNVDKKQSTENLDSTIEQIISSKKSKKKISEVITENEDDNIEKKEELETTTEEVEKIPELKHRLKLVDDHYTITENDFMIEYCGCEGRPFHLGLPFRNEKTNSRHFFMKLKGQRKGQLHVGPEHGHTVIDNTKTVVNFSELNNIFGAFTEDGTKWYSLDNKGTLGKANLQCITNFIGSRQDTPLDFVFYGHHTDLSGNFTISKYSSCLKYDIQNRSFIFCGDPTIVKFDLSMVDTDDLCILKFLVNNELITEGKGNKLSDVFILNQNDSVKVVIHTISGDRGLNGGSLKITQIA